MTRSRPAGSARTAGGIRLAAAGAPAYPSGRSVAGTFARSYARGFAHALAGALAGAFTVAAAVAVTAAVAWASPATAREDRPALVDGLGNRLPAGPCPDRIVSLSPSVTEILFALGVDSTRIVGVTRYCDTPPEARRRPVVGGIIDPSAEAIAMQRPDLVLAVRGNPRPVLEQLQHLGLPVFGLDDRTDLRGVAAMMRQLEAVSCPDDRARADSAISRYARRLATYEAWSAGIPAGERPTVFYTDPEYPTWTAGAGSHIDDLIRVAGGRNTAGGLPGWPQVSLERLVLDQPRYLLVSIPAGLDRDRVYKELAAKPGWSSLAALQENRICWVDAAVVQRPGPRLVSVLEGLAACLHPDRERP